MLSVSLKQEDVVIDRQVGECNIRLQRGSGKLCACATETEWGRERQASKKSKRVRAREKLGYSEKERREKQDASS